MPPDKVPRPETAKTNATAVTKIPECNVFISLVHQFEGNQKECSAIAKAAIALFFLNFPH
jgi:hypothetical protein